MNGHSTTIVVQDDSGLGKHWLKELKSIGGRVVVAPGKEAHALIERNKPTSVIIGETTCHDLAEFFWQQRCHPEIPFFLLETESLTKDVWFRKFEAKYWGVRILKPAEVYEEISKLKQDKYKPPDAATEESKLPLSSAHTQPSTSSNSLVRKLVARIKNGGYELSKTERSGQGGFGTVILGKNQSGMPVGIKIVEGGLSEREWEAIRRYMRFSLSRRNKGLVKIFHVDYINPDFPDKGIWYVMELADNWINGH